MQEKNRSTGAQMLLKPHESFVLVIDVQEKLAPAILGIDRVEKNLATLLPAAGRLAVPAVVTEHCADKIGHTIPPLRQLVKGDAIVHKKRFSAQSEPLIAERFSSLKRNKIVVVGNEAHVCVLQTTLDLVSAGYHPHLMVDGMFNVNSTSVDAWHALFAGIRERKVVFRDKDGDLKAVAVPDGKRIAVSRFNVATTDQEGDSPVNGVSRDDGMLAWSGVRFLDNAQLRKLAEECVKQVKQRGPFLNFSEFINRRLSNDNLGIMGALQSAIDYDDASPAPGSINYPFKSDSDYMLEESDLGGNAFETSEAAVGSRFAGIPGYVIQSDILKPIANTLSVRDDTFRIRAYGDSLDENGNVVARAWCEAVAQRVPDPVRPDSTGLNPDAEAPGTKFGRRFRLVSFRWLAAEEV